MQKTAYEMRSSNWSSDVCSSDLARVLDPLGAPDLRGFGERRLLRQPRLDLRLVGVGQLERSEEHTSELQSLMRNSYAVFCLKKKNNNDKLSTTHSETHCRFSSITDLYI